MFDFENELKMCIGKYYDTHHSKTGNFSLPIHFKVFSSAHDCSTVGEFVLTKLGKSASTQPQQNITMHDDDVLYI